MHQAWATHMVRHRRMGVHLVLLLMLTHTLAKQAHLLMDPRAEILYREGSFALTVSGSTVGLHHEHTMNYLRCQRRRPPCASPLLRKAFCTRLRTPAVFVLPAATKDGRCALPAVTERRRITPTPVLWYGNPATHKGSSSSEGKIPLYLLWCTCAWSWSL